MHNLSLPPHIRAVIFDLDGTLIASSHVWHDIDVKFMQKRGLTVPADYCDAIATMNFREGADYTISRFGLKESPEAVIAEWREMARYEYAHNIGAKPRAVEYLSRLKAQGMRLGLATASSRDLYLPVLERLGAAGYFDAFTSTEEVSRSKDHPDVYLFAAGRLGIPVSECAVFEDVPAALKSAASAGFCTCALLDEADDKSAAAMQNIADICFHDYQELLV